MTAKMGPKHVTSSCHLDAFDCCRSRPIAWLTSLLLLLSCVPAGAENSWLSRQTGSGVGPRLEMEDVGSFMGSLYFRECIRNEMAAACKALTDGSRADVRANTWAKARAHEKLGQLNELRGDSCAALADYIQSVQLNPTKALKARLNALVDRIGGTCQALPDQQDYLNALSLGTQQSANAGLSNGPWIIPEWTTSIRWAQLPKLERLRLLKDLGHQIPVTAAQTFFGQEIEAVDPLTVLLNIRSIELDRDNIVTSFWAENGNRPIEATSAHDGQISATRPCNPSDVAIRLDCSPLMTGSLPNFVPVNFSVLTKNGPATGDVPTIILSLAVLVLLSGFVFVVARTSWPGARQGARARAPRVGQRVVIDDLSGRIDTLRSGLTTRLQHRAEEAINFDEIDRTKSGEPDATADVLYPSRQEPVLAGERPDTVNSLERIIEFSVDRSVDRAVELDRVLGLLQEELEEAPNNIQPRIQPKSADSRGSDSACDRLTDRGAKVESHLIALNDPPGALLILDGDGRVTKELQASQAIISLSDRAKPYLLVTPEAAETAGLLNPFVDSGLGSDPLIRQHYLSAKFDLHAWIFDAMFGVSFVSQNQNTLRHFSNMLVRLPNASFRTWQDLISEEC